MIGALPRRRHRQGRIAITGNAEDAGREARAGAFDIPEPHAAVDLTMADGAVIRVCRHGNAHGPRLIMSHGNGFATDGYWPLWRLMLERYDLVLFDFRNHGRNPYHGPLGHDWANFVRDMDQVLDGIDKQFGAKTSIGVFHSMSAVTSLRHAVLVGWRWDALCVFDPPLIPADGHPLQQMGLDGEEGLARWALKRDSRYDGPQGLADMFAGAKTHFRWVPGAHLGMAHAVLHLDEAAGDWALTCPRRLESSVYGTNMDSSLWPRLGEISGPVKFIAADPDAEDALWPASGNRAIGEEFDHAYECIRDTNHLLEIERPDECFRAIESFLAEVGINA